MRQREFNFKLETTQGGTLPQRIARLLQEAILAGRLKPGTHLPGSRALSQSLGVTRNTAIAALQSLEAEGWVRTEANRGTFVAEQTPRSPGSHPQVPTPLPTSPGFDLPSELSPISAFRPEVIHLEDGLPDPRLVPTEALAKAYQRALRRHGRSLLGYGEAMGNRMLREATAGWLSERYGIAVPVERVLITRGSRTALSLLALSLLKPGDHVGVESPGNRAAWETLRQCVKVTLHPLPVDGEGLCVEALEELVRTTPLKALYLTPRRQFPTGASMGSQRGRTLLALAAAHRIALIEDDYDATFHFGESAPLPLLGLDRTGQVIHLASLSRLLAPGIRLGFLIAPESLVGRLASVRRQLEWQGDRVLEWAIADLIRDGEMDRHLRRVRKVYEERRNFLMGLLSYDFPEDLSFEAPRGGLSLWITVQPHLSAQAWVDAAAAKGLRLHSPSHFYFNQPGPSFRMGFAQANPFELEEAVHRLKQ